LVFTVSATHGVGQPASAASFDSAPPDWFGPPFVPSVALGVFQPFSNKPEPLSDMRRAEARSAEIDRPEGVTRTFHVSVYKVEPTEAVLARNLFAKDDWRAALANEAEEIGPEVAGVIDAAALSGCAERLTGTGAGPDGPVVGPPGKTQSMAPDADAGEEVALAETFKVVRLNIDN
jgi:hypothetical protein